MTVTHVGMAGRAPTVLVRPSNPEAAKYTELWNRPEYREIAPGEQLAMQFLTQAKPRADSEVIDFGCGTGRGALMIALLGRCKVQMLDFASNCLDAEVVQACQTQGDRLKFAHVDLTKSVPFNSAYGYCTDVMEHIPPRDVGKVLRNVLASSQHVFFGIATRPDQLGELIGEQLHLTVQPMSWWLKQLTDLGAVIHWTQEWEGECAIYCSAWQHASELVAVGKVNTDLKIVEAQTRANIEAGWMHITPHDTQSREVILLAGGPSATEHIDKIRELREAGAALVTVNGAYEWALAQGLKVSVQIVLDAREFNARFTRNVQPHVKYLIASQVHPSTLEGLPRDRTFLWHSGVSPEIETMVRERCNGAFFPVPGGSTVVLRALPLMRMLGLTKFHIFGFDSCLIESKHHAYDQVENEGDPVIPVNCGGRMFSCAPWMVSQAQEFQDFVKAWGDLFELAVYGDGLIAHMVTTGAQLASEARDA